MQEGFEHQQETIISYFEMAKNYSFCPAGFMEALAGR